MLDSLRHKTALTSIAVIALMVAATSCWGGDSFKGITFLNLTGETIDLFVISDGSGSAPTAAPPGTVFRKASVDHAGLKPGESIHLFIWTSTENIGSETTVYVGVIDSESTELIQWVTVEYSELRANDFKLTLTSADLGR